MAYVLIGAVLIVAVFGPQLWVRGVIRRHSREIPGMPGTGGDLAAHLIRTRGLEGVVVERTTEGGDHYDPSSRTVRLSPSHYDGRSLSAVAVAVHEVGHAIQHHEGYQWLELRGRLAPTVRRVEQVGMFLLACGPVLSLLTRMPAPGALLVVAGLTSLFARVVFHAVTLPVELDASYRRAMPIIREGQFVAPSELGSVHHVLTAAACTYVAAALADVLSIWRWLIILRRG